MAKREKHPSEKSTNRDRARGFLVSVVWLVILQFLDYQGWFALLNGRVFNKILSWHTTGAETEASKDVYLIQIDDAAYKQCFNEQSPMDPKRVLSLVKLVAEENPKAIGVDIRTEGEEYSKHIQEFKSYVSSIVWIAAFDNQKPHVPSFGNWLFGDRDYIAVSPLPVLGVSPFALPNTRQTNWGLPMYPRDEDGNVRRFPRSVHLAATDVQSGGSAPSWAARVADVYCRPECTAETTDEIYISYAGTPPHPYNLQELFSCQNDLHDPNASHDLVANGPKWQSIHNSHLLRGRIVLIGGTFKSSGDFYKTPKGEETAGLLVNAFAVKADLDGNGFEDLRQPLAWMLDLLLGLLIVVATDEEVLQRLDGRYRGPHLICGWKRKKIVLATGLVISVCVGSLFFAHGRYLMGFAGEAAGVLVDRMRDLWEFSEDK